MSLKLEQLAPEILDNIFSHLDGNLLLSHLAKSNKHFYESIVPFYLKDMDHFKLCIPKVEQVKKANKTIDDLLTWNREVKFILNQAQRLTELDFSCHDFKIFNPLNEKLISCEQFPYLRHYSVGVFDEDKFPK